MLFNLEFESEDLILTVIQKQETFDGEFLFFLALGNC